MRQWLDEHKAFFLLACAAFLLFAPLLTNVFTGDDMVHYFQFDYRPWIKGFSNHGRLGQAVIVLAGQAVGFNLVRQQVLGRVLALGMLSLAAYALYRAARPHLQEPSAQRLGGLGCFLAVFNVYTIELFSYSMATLTYAFSLLLSVLAASRLAGGFDRRRLWQAFALMFSAYWFYQNTPPYFVGFSVFFLCAAAARDGEPLGALARKTGVVLGMYLAASLLNTLYVTKVHGLIYHDAHTARVALDPALPLRMFGGMAARAGWHFLNDYGLPSRPFAGPLALAACLAAFVVSLRKERWGGLPFLFCAGTMAFLSVAPNALNTEYYVPARSMPAIGGLIGFALLAAAMGKSPRKGAGLLACLGLAFAFCVGLDTARVVASMRVSNRLDVERAKRICRLIAEGEQAQRVRVSKVYFVPDARPTAVYPGVTAFPDTSMSMIAVDWSRVPLLRFVSQREFQRGLEDADPAVVTFIRQRDWTPFVDPEQVLVKGDAAYVAIL